MWLVYDSIQFCIWYYIIYPQLFGWSIPGNYNDESRAERKGIAQVALRTVGLFHALYTCLIGYAYIFGLIPLSWLFNGRIASCAFLAYDFRESWRTYERMTSIRDHSESSKRAMSKNAIQSPVGVLFHHVVTIMFMYGWWFNAEVGGVLLYFQSELPVFFINVVWIMSYKGLDNTVRCTLAANLSVVTYVICRIFMFPFIWFLVIIPNLEFTSWCAWGFQVLLIGVYAMNVWWFNLLLEKNRKFLPCDFDPQAPLSQLPCA